MTEATAVVTEEEEEATAEVAEVAMIEAIMIEMMEAPGEEEEEEEAAAEVEEEVEEDMEIEMEEEEDLEIEGMIMEEVEEVIETMTITTMVEAGETEMLIEEVVTETEVLLDINQETTITVAMMTKASLDQILLNLLTEVDLPLSLGKIQLQSLLEPQVVMLFMLVT